MAQRMFGLETEYAFAALGAGGTRVDPQRATSLLMDLACRTLPHLRGEESRGIFLQNGSRFYLDTGMHPELSTCEVLDPWDACRYALAGDRILEDLTRQLPSADPEIRQVFVGRSNVGYGPADPTTWAAHESYGHRADPELLPDELMPHLVSRLIYTGAGGFDNRSPGVQFMLSPRVAHLEQVVAHDATSSRGIFHTKDETLSGGGYHRLHIACGESVCSQTALWLKTAVTALVVAMVEADLRPCAGIRLRDPLDAMRRFALDTTCTATAEDVEGRPWTALQIQLQIQRRLERHVNHPLMPVWATEACRRLRETLDRLAQGPGAVAKTLDWAIKLAVYQDFARRQGVDWEQPLRLRQQLFELDTRFSQLGEQGLFAALDRAAALEHRVPGMKSIEEAVTTPPGAGRARLRGSCVQRFSGLNGRYHCDWTGVWDHQDRCRLDLSDPFAAEEKWQQMPAPEEPARPRPPTALQSLNRVRELYNDGRYEEAHERLRRICVQWEAWDTLLESQWEAASRLYAVLRSRQGELDDSQGLQQPDADPDSFSTILGRVAVYRFAGLVPDPQITIWIQKGLEFIRCHPDIDRSDVAALDEHYGYHLLAEDRLQQARRVLERVTEGALPEALESSVWCRALATLGEVHRRLGNSASALHLVERAAGEQGGSGLRGDLADFSLMYLAKLQPQRTMALTMLEQAESMQVRNRNRLGEARTILLKARLAEPDAETTALRERVLRLKDGVPALGRCRLLAKVLSRWDAWVEDKDLPDESGDVFWGV